MIPSLHTNRQFCGENLNHIHFIHVQIKEEMSDDTSNDSKGVLLVPAAAVPSPSHHENPVQSTMEFCS